MLSNKIAYFKKINNFGNDHFFKEAISFVFEPEARVL